MATKFLSTVDLKQNQLQNAVLHPLTTANITALPTPVPGQIVFDSDLDVLKYYSGSVWIPLGKMEQLLVGGTVNLGTNNIQTSFTPAGNTDLTNKLYVDTAINSAVSSAVTGIRGKTSVRAATTATVGTVTAGTLTACPNILDGVTLVANNRVLVKDHVSQIANGIYIVSTLGTGSNGVWTRDTDADTWNELVSAFTFVEEGSASNKDTGWLCTVDAGGTLNTTNVTWVQFSAAGQINGTNIGTGVGQIFAQKNGTNLEFKKIIQGTGISITNGATDITIAVDNTSLKTAGFTKVFTTTNTENTGNTCTITHSLNNQYPQIAIMEVSSSATVFTDIAYTNANSFIATFSATVTTGMYRFTVIG